VRVIRHNDVKSAVLVLTGEIDYCAMKQIRRQIEDLLLESFQFFVLDMEQVLHIQYGSLHELVECARQVRNRFGGICVTRLNPYLKDILQLMDVNCQFEIFNASEECYLHKIYPAATPGATALTRTA
jgi:anti-anti-sigma factor